MVLLLEYDRRLWFLAVVHDKLLVEQTLAGLATRGVQERYGELVIRLGATVVVDRSANGVYRVRGGGTVRSLTDLLVPREYLFRLVPPAGNLLEAGGGISQHDRPRIAKVSIVIAVPLVTLATLGTGTVESTHLFFLVRFTPAAASLITSRSNSRRGRRGRRW